jgi:hypothetical protein
MSSMQRRLDMPIGVEALAERPFLQLLLRPFLSRDRRAAGTPERRA